MTPEEQRELVADGLMTIQDAAKFLGVSRPLLYTIHDLPWIRIGRRRLLPRRAVIELAVRSMELKPELPPFFLQKPKGRTHEL